MSVGFLRNWYFKLLFFCTSKFFLCLKNLFCAVVFANVSSKLFVKKDYLFSSVLWNDDAVTAPDNQRLTWKGIRHFFAAEDRISLYISVVVANNILGKSSRGVFSLKVLLNLSFRSWKFLKFRKALGKFFVWKSNFLSKNHFFFLAWFNRAWRNKLWIRG